MNQRNRNHNSSQSQLFLDKTRESSVNIILSRMIEIVEIVSFFHPYSPISSHTLPDLTYHTNMLFCKNFSSFYILYVKTTVTGNKYTL